MYGKLSKIFGIAVLVLLALACSGQKRQTSTTPMSTATDDNVLLADWTGPYGGVPAYDKMDLALLKPALEAGMARQLEEIEAIAQNPDPPTFENTIEEMERAGRDFPPRDQLLGDLELLPLDAGVPGDPERDGAQALRVLLQDHAEPRAVRSHPRPSTRATS